MIICVCFYLGLSQEPMTPRCLNPTVKQVDFPGSQALFSIQLLRLKELSCKMICSVIWQMPESLTQQWRDLCPALMDCSTAIFPLPNQVGVFYVTVLLLWAQSVEAVTCQTVPYMQFIFAQKEIVEGHFLTVWLNCSAPCKRKSPETA